MLSSQEIHDISVAIGIEPGAKDINWFTLRQNLYSRRCGFRWHHIATLLCALFVKHFRPLVAAGHIYVAMPPLFRIDHGKEVYYALDEAEKKGILDRISAETKEEAKSMSFALKV